MKLTHYYLLIFVLFISPQTHASESCNLVLDPSKSKTARYGSHSVHPFYALLSTSGRWFIEVDCTDNSGPCNYKIKDHNKIKNYTLEASTVTINAGSPYDFAFNKDENTLFAVANGQKTFSLNLETAKANIRAFPPAIGHSLDAWATPNGKYVKFSFRIAPEDSRTHMIRNNLNGKDIKLPSLLRDADVSESLDVAYGINVDNKLVVYSLGKGETLYEPDFGNANVRTISKANTKNEIFVALDQDGKTIVQKLDLQSGKLQQVASYNTLYKKLEFSPLSASETLIAGNDDGSKKINLLSGGKTIVVQADDSDKKPFLHGISEDGKQALFISASTSNTEKVTWHTGNFLAVNAETGEIIKKPLKTNISSTSTLARFVDESHILMVFDNKLNLWDLTNNTITNVWAPRDKSHVAPDYFDLSKKRWFARNTAAGGDTFNYFTPAFKCDSPKQVGPDEMLNQPGK